MDTRQRILAAARSLAEEGRYDAGLGEIGRRAGISRQAVYLHFASKAQLLTELVTWVEEQAGLSDLLAPVRTANSGEEALHALIEAGAAFEPQAHALARVAERARYQDPAMAAILADRMQGASTPCAPSSPVSPQKAGWPPAGTSTPPPHSSGRSPHLRHSTSSSPNEAGHPSAGPNTPTNCSATPSSAPKNPRSAAPPRSPRACLLLSGLRIL